MNSEWVLSIFEMEMFFVFFSFRNKKQEITILPASARVNIRNNFSYVLFFSHCNINLYYIIIEEET